MQDITDIQDFTAWLMPRIDSAAVILLRCNEWKDDLVDVIADDFSKWTAGVNEKSHVLTHMYDDWDEVDPNTGDKPDFMTFLTATRAEYDTLKDAGGVLIIDPQLEIPAILDACPQEVHDQLSVAESFQDILEDCYSYLEWLKAQSGGYCELPQFTEIAVAHAAEATDAEDEVAALVGRGNLYDVKAEEGETPEAFAERMRAAFDAATVDPVSSGITVPETSLACPQDAMDAHAAAVAFVASLEDNLTYIAYLKDILDGCCNEVTVDYEGIRVIAAPKLAAVEEERDAYVEALYVFEGMSDLGETLDDFTTRFRAMYDATNPLVVPVISLETFIDVPALCPAATITAAQELVDLVGSLNDNSAYLEWLQGRLSLAAQLEEINLEMLIAMIRPRITHCEVEMKANLDDLFSFTANDGETMDQFTDRMIAEFDAYLLESGRALEDTGVVIPDVPELADDDTEALRDTLVDLEHKLAYCMTFNVWLEEGIFIPCENLRNEFESALADN